MGAVKKEQVYDTVKVDHRLCGTKAF